MIDLLMEPRWSPYLAGAGIGILLWCAFLFSGRPIGCGTAFSRTAGMIESIISSEKVKEKEYYKLVPPVIEWQWMLVLGIIIGAFISSMLGGTFEVTMVPDLFMATFGDNPLLRILVAIAGGIFMGLGARWAWGCTSGHGISGLAQLSLASIVAASGFFGAGIVTAYIIYAL